MVAAPAQGGGWLGRLDVDHDRPAPDRVIGTGVLFDSRTDPADPGGVLAVPLDEEGRALLVVTPAAAVTVRVLRDGREVVRGQVVSSGAVLAVPYPASIGPVVEALDAAGVVLATGTPATFGNDQGDREVDAWDEE